MVRDLLLRGLLAGALAGLLAFAVAALFGEPPLELAIGFEASLARAADHAMEPERVSRSVQRGIGLLVACVAVGLALGGLLALAFRQDAAVLRSVDQAMARITAGTVASAA